MHKSWGNAIWFDDAVEQMGADVMRWMFAGQNPAQNMNFGYGPAERCSRRLLPLWNSYRFLVLYAGPEGCGPTRPSSSTGPARAPARPLDRRARPGAGARRARRARPLRRRPTYVRACEAFFDDLSNWYVRRSRPRFWRATGRLRRRCTTRSCSRRA